MEYNWSSYREHKDNKRNNRLTDTEFALKMFHDDNDLAIKAFIEYTNEQNGDKCLEIVDKRKKLTDDELKK